MDSPVQSIKQNILKKLLANLTQFYTLTLQKRFAQQDV
jgi:hypothetical protein